MARLAEMYPDCAFPKPEFTALPRYLSSGADFTLIPSRVKPFGLAAVEFGCQSTLGASYRLGGLGLMPSWESNALGRPFSCNRSIPSGLSVALLPSQGGFMSQERAMDR